ncbi:MAG: hypothetical protein M5U19_11895 [Microthrixaceae bacterium]|nr:hypothetical protein [Microthrixaceae bacterium]
MPPTLIEVSVIPRVVASVGSWVSEPPSVVEVPSSSTDSEHAMSNTVLASTADTAVSLFLVIVTPDRRWFGFRCTRM